MTTALITGASSGIGRELARLFARHGHRVVLVARTESALDALAQELRAAGAEAVVLPADLSQPTAVAALFAQVWARGLEVDFLINNAGFGEFGLFADTPWEREAELLDLNVRGLTQLTKLFLPGMLARRMGRILQVASTAAFQPGPLMAVYFASKAYVLSFSEALANELQGTGVTVTALCPGPTETNFQRAAAVPGQLLVRDQRLMSATVVAAYAYRALLRGQVVAIPGRLNWLLAFSVRFAPRGVVTTLARRLMERATH